MSLPTGPTGPFRSSYMEATASVETVGTGSDFTFDTDIDSYESVGNNITLDPTGKVFTIYRTGLYHIEWSINLAANTTAAVVGIVENGQLSSAATTNHGGNFSSGTLINVTTVPFTIELRNFAEPVQTAVHPLLTGNAVSLRIARFADSPSM